MTKWMVQNNPKMFDAVGAFAELGKVDWRQVIKAEVGDTVYIYVAAPIKAIKIKCKVIEVNLPTETIEDSKFTLDGASFENYGKYMRLELVENYDDNLLPYDKMTQHGLKSVQGPMRIVGELDAFIESVSSSGATMLELRDITDNVLIIKINKSFREDMSPLELYDVTRGCWKRKLESVSKAEYALSVSDSIVREVYRIDNWKPSYEVKRETIANNPDTEKERITFTGEVADDDVRNKYLGKNVKNLYKWGEADPLKLILGKSDGENVDSINVAKKPIDIIQEDGGDKVVCPKCKTKFKRAMRCPECGQLILYKEKWNKPKLTDLDDWIAASNIDGATSREVGDFVRKVCANDGFSYHVGAVDLSVDIVDSEDRTIMSVFMLFGKGGSFAFQPLALEGGAEKYHLKKDAITVFLEKMKLFLIPDQKNKPYERYNGYYYIDYKTLVEKAAEIERILIDFKNAL